MSSLCFGLCFFSFFFVLGCHEWADVGRAVRFEHSDVRLEERVADIGDSLVRIQGIVAVGHFITVIRFPVFWPVFFSMFFLPHRYVRRNTWERRVIPHPLDFRFVAVEVAEQDHELLLLGGVLCHKVLQEARLYGVGQSFYLRQGREWPQCTQGCPYSRALIRAQGT